MIIPDTEIIKIDEKLIGGEFINVGAVQDYSSTLNHVASLYMFSDLPKFYGQFGEKMDQDVEKFAEDKTKAKEAFSNDNFWQDSNSYSIWVFALIIVVLIVLLIYFIRKSNIIKRRKNNNNWVEEIELS